MAARWLTLLLGVELAALTGLPGALWKPWPLHTVPAMLQMGRELASEALRLGNLSATYGLKPWASAPRGRITWPPGPAFLLHKTNGYIKITFSSH